ncbi:MAG: penicillin-binding protein 2 [Endomicrobium sp.]|jgi:penicillin-binding protein 2|uniref:penicillin-binding protein 2 n=1 Tax=Candidatus Endomicrobiellum cubanum TaxID=3242325 RepID=UPI0028234FC2|nr:penicillin-binding protein 2 [Endomicrobium sp.]
MVWQKKDKFSYEIFLAKHKVILVFFMFLFLSLSLRLFYLQIINGSKYKNISEYQKIHNTKECAKRGIIYSADGQILAESKNSYAVLYYPCPGNQKPSEQILLELSKILQKEIKPSNSLFSKYGRKVMVLVENLTLNEVFKIQEKKFKLKGITITKASKRLYHFSKETSHVIGYISQIQANEMKHLSGAGYKLGDYIGRGGIEQYYDEYLQGKDGGWQIEVNSKGDKVRMIKYVPPETGNSIYSTIDLKLQYCAYNALKNSDTGKGAVVVLDVKSGNVKALVSCPGFDSNKVLNNRICEYIKDGKLPLFNRALQALYPPGSTFKFVTFAAAMDLLDINPYETIDCKGKFELGDRIYVCYHKTAHGRLNLISAMAVSCNVYFYNLGLKLGIRNLEVYTRKFLFGQKTGIDLPNEKQGFIPTPEWKKSKFKVPWLQGDTLIFTIGQGAICVTPLQMAHIMATIAKRGFICKPYVVDKIVDLNGNEIYKHENSQIKDRIELSNRTWEFLHKSLLEVVENGTARRCKIPGIKISGKTGTAQNPHKKDHSWFISYAPSDNPEIAVAVIVEHGGSGGLNAVPIAKRIYETYFGISASPVLD